MKNKPPLDLKALFKQKLGDTLDDFILPPPIFEINIYVKTKLIEEKKRRLTFEAGVEDEEGVVYAVSTLVKYMVKTNDT